MKYKWINWFFLFFLFSFIIETNFLLADVILKQGKDKKGNITLSISNNYFRIIITPSKGGSITSFVDKATGKEWLSDIITSPGLFYDHVWQQTWPGELFYAPYNFSIEKKDKKECRIKVWKVITGKINEQIDVNIANLLLEKTYIIEDRNPFIKTMIRISNPTEKNKFFGYWMQNIFCPGGKRNSVYFRPSTQGIEVASVRIGKDGRQIFSGKEFVKNPNNGWMGTLNPETMEGAIFLVDYNYTRWLYNCRANYTTEIFYDKVTLPPGKFWETQILFIPNKGFKGYTYASENIIADINIRKQTNQQILITHTLYASTRTLNHLTLTSNVFSFPDNRLLKQSKFKISHLEFQPIKRQETIKLTPGQEIVVKVNISGENISEEYETFYTPKYELKELFRYDFGYRAPKRRKKKHYFKPSQIVKLPHKGTVILDIHGLYHYLYGVEKAAKLIPNSKLVNSYFMEDVYGKQISYFPSSYRELMSLDIIALSNIPSSVFGDEEEEYIKDFVKYGGGLLIFGDYFAFAHSDYKDNKLADLIPVELKNSFDITSSEPLLLKPVTKSEIVKGISFREKPVVLYYHNIKGVKPGAKVILKAGEKPFLITYRYGKGRVAICTGTVLGVEPEGKIVFWKWKEWPKLVANILNWLKGR